MINYDPFFSHAAATMRESAIRQMGAVLAGAKDIVSFAPGYPAEDTFPWQAFADVAGELLTGTDGSVLQYGPTRGHRPLREVITGLMADRGVRSAVAADQIIVTTGSQQGLDLVARVLLDPGDVVLLELPSYTGAITAFRNVGASLVGVRQDEDGLDLEALGSDDARARRRRPAREIPLPRAELPESDRAARQPREASRAPRVGAPARPSHRRRRSVPGFVLSGRRDARGATRARSRPTTTRGMSCTSAAFRRRWRRDSASRGSAPRPRSSPNSKWQSRPRTCAPDRSISGSCTRPAGAAYWRSSCPCCARTTSTSATSWFTR